MANAADAADDTTDEVEVKKKPLLMKLLIPIVALVVIAAAAGGYFFFVAGGESEPTVGPDGQEIVEAPETYFYDLPDLTVNLTTADGRPAYLKMKIALEVTDRSIFNEIEPNIPKVMDTFQVYLRELRSTDLQGSGGLYRMKEELLRRINIAIFPAKVHAVLFQEILVQ